MAEHKFSVMGSDFTCEEMAFKDGDILGSFNKKIDAPVGAGPRARNLPKDVLTIKELLNRVPLTEGGPIPMLDMTKDCDAAMMKAIKNFQQYRLADDSGVIDPKGETLQVLNYNPAAMPDLTKEAVKHIQRATEIIVAARGALSLAKFQLNRPALPGGLPSLNSSPVLDKLNRHFHLDKSTTASDDLDYIDGVYSDMQTAIGYIPKGLKLFRNDTGNHPWYAFSYNGGYDVEQRFKTVGSGASRWNLLGSIYLCGDLQKMDDEGITYILIHELAHYVGPEPQTKAIKDFGYAHKPGYDKLTPEKALRTADCYSQFAFEVINRRFDPKQHTKKG